MKEVVICDAYHFLEASKHLHDCGKRLQLAVSILSKPHIRIEELAAALDGAAEDYAQCALAMSEAIKL